MPALLPREPRIVLVIDRFDGRRGGAALWTRGFAAWLAMRNCDVHVLARSVGPAESRLPLAFHRIDATRGPTAFAAAVAARLATIRPLFSHDMGAAVGCVIFQPHFGSGAACWDASFASYPAWRRPLKRLCGFTPRRRRLARMCDQQFSGASQSYIAVSHMVARDMQWRHNVPRHRIHIVHNGVDLDRFAPAALRAHRLSVRRRLGIGKDEVALIAVAHHFRLKGMHGLIRVVQRLRREGAPATLLVCGGRPRATPGAPRGNAGVIHCGHVSDVAPFYAAADICVHPTYYDACSLVTLEALAAGLPVVTTRANGASELLTDGVDGILLDSPDDDRALANVLRALINSPDVRRNLGAAGRRLAERHSIERNYAAIAEVYAATLATRLPNPPHTKPAAA